MSIEGFVDIAGQYEFSALVTADYINSITTGSLKFDLPQSVHSNICEMFDIARKSFEKEKSCHPVRESATYNFIIQLIYRNGISKDPRSIDEMNNQVKIFSGLVERLKCQQEIDLNDITDYLRLEQLLRIIAKVGDSNRYAQAMGVTRPPEFCYPI